MSKRTLQADDELEDEDKKEAFRKLCLELASRRSDRVVALAKIKAEASVGAGDLDAEADTSPKSKKQKGPATEDVLETIVVSNGYTLLAGNAAAQGGDTTGGNTTPNTKFEGVSPGSSTRPDAYTVFRAPNDLAHSAATEGAMASGSSGAVPGSPEALDSPPIFITSSALSPSVAITVKNILTTIIHSYHGVCLHVMPSDQLAIPSSSLPYAEAINSSPLVADKLMAFRARGPSFSAISSRLLPHPTPVTPIFIIRWMTMRLFAFGRLDLIESLASMETAADVLAARELYQTTTGAGVNTLPVYGNVCFDPRRVPDYIDKIFEKAHVLSSFLATRKATFEDTMQKIKEMQVPYHSGGTIFQWLLTCDLAEVGLVYPPTPRDLAMRLWTCGFKKKGGKGAWEGFTKGIDVTQFEDILSVEDYLIKVYEGVKEKLHTDLAVWGGENIFREEGFWYSDLEHCLCKVARAEKYDTSLSHA